MQPPSDADNTVFPADESSEATNASSVNLPPAAPVKRGMNRVLLFSIISGALAVVLVVTFILASAALANTAPSVPQILSSAESASLNNAAFTFNANVGIGFSATGAPTTVSLTGSGAFDMKNNSMKASVNLPALIGQASTVNFIAVDNAIYFQDSALTQNTPYAGAWLKLDASSMGNGNGKTTTFSLKDLYTHISNPTLVGSETINGTDTWHLKGVLAMHSATAATPVSGASTPVAVKPVSVDIWVTKNTYYLAKVVFSGSESMNLGNFAQMGSGMGGIFGQGGAGTANNPSMPSGMSISINLTATMSSWNAGQSIQAPSGTVINASQALPIIMQQLLKGFGPALGQIGNLLTPTP